MFTQEDRLRGNRIGVRVRQERARCFAQPFRPILERYIGKASYREIARLLNSGGIKTPRGCDWSGVQVKRMVNILGIEENN